jgi:hypothetical protein
MKLIKLMAGFMVIFYFMLFIWVMLTSMLVEENFMETTQNEIYENAFDDCMRENLLNDVMCDKFAKDIAYGEKS